MKKMLAVVGSTILALGLTACGGGGGGGSSSTPTTSSTPTPTPTPSPVDTGSFDYGVMFTNLADNVIIPNYQAFQTSVEEFVGANGALTAYCDAIGGSDESSSLDAAQTAWRAMMVQWQRAEAHNLGPAAAEASLLRNQIYAYDTRPFDSCRTDRAVVLAEDAGFDINTRDFNSRGLDGLEYLLFEDDLSHTCTSSNPQTDAWNARTEQDRKQARCAYAVDVANDINSAATNIVNEWQASGGNYRQTFIGNSDTHELILESISDALFYIEKDAKDGKLGVALGFHADCSATACPSDVESPYSQHELQNIRANVEAFWNIYTGGEGPGFDDIISDADMSSVNTEFNTTVDAILALVNSMIDDGDSVSAQAQTILDSGSRTACENSSADPTDESVSACALHGLVKQLTDRLRTDFVTIVGVDLPDRVRGDND